MLLRVICVMAITSVAMFAPADIPQAYLGLSEDQLDWKALCLYESLPDDEIKENHLWVIDRLSNVCKNPKNVQGKFKCADIHQYNGLNYYYFISMSFGIPLSQKLIEELKSMGYPPIPGFQNHQESQAD